MRTGAHDVRQAHGHRRLAAPVVNDDVTTPGLVAIGPDKYLSDRGLPGRCHVRRAEAAGSFPTREGVVGATIGPFGEGGITPVLVGLPLPSHRTRVVDVYHRARTDERVAPDDRRLPESHVEHVAAANHVVVLRGDGPIHQSIKTDPCVDETGRAGREVQHIVRHGVVVGDFVASQLKVGIVEA